MGIESIYAEAIPDTVLVAPGPEVTRHTPTLPDARVYTRPPREPPPVRDVR